MNDFEIVSVAPLITVITSVFYISFYFKIFSAVFLIIIILAESAASIERYVPSSLSRFMMAGLLLGIAVS